jgi:hypothetical protein
MEVILKATSRLDRKMATGSLNSQILVFMRANSGIMISKDREPLPGRTLESTRGTGIQTTCMAQGK